MKNFLRTLIHPDREEADTSARADVIKAANVLQVGEFQLLQLAYYDWHGADIPRDMMDRLFSSYMIKSRVPPWARHYARKIFELNANGSLDANDTSYHRFDVGYRTRAPRGLARFCLASLALLVIIGGVLWAGNEITGPQQGTSFLPPYFDEKELGMRKNQP